MMSVGNIMSTLGLFNTLEDSHEYTWRYHDACGGYREYMEDVHYTRGMP